MRRHILTLMMAAAIPAAQAQDLHTEITVDRTVQPNIRESYRMSGVNATTLTPSVTVAKPTVAEYSTPGALTNDFSVLPAAPWNDSIPKTPYRGYITAGYFPLVNGMVDGGYKFVDTDQAQVGAWLQYNGYSYNGDFDRYEQALYANNFGSIGLNARLRTSATSVLTADIVGTYGNVRHPYYNLYYQTGVGFIEQRRSYHQSSWGGNLDVRWDATSGQLATTIKAGLDYFGLGDNTPTVISSTYRPVSQKGGHVGLGLGLLADDTPLPWLGVDVDWDILNSNNMPYTDPTYNKVIYHTATITEGHVNPYLRFDNDKLRGRVGLNIDIATGDGDNHVKWSPDVVIEYTPVRVLTIFGRAQGGEHINRMSTLYQHNPYMANYLAYGRSYTPLMLTGGAELYPVSWLRIVGEVGFAVAKDYLVPQITRLGTGLTRSSYYAHDVTSAYAGLGIDLAIKHVVKLHAGAKLAKARTDIASWIYIYDGAKRIYDATLTVMPTSKLELEVSFQKRDERHVRQVIYPYASADQTARYNALDLGNLNDLMFKGSYAINQRLTVFANVDNILNCHYLLPSGMAGQPINGLVGLAYKF